MLPTNSTMSRSDGVSRCTKRAESEAPRHAGRSSPDRHADGEVGQLVASKRLPGPLALELEQLRQPPADGQDHHQHVFGDRARENTPRALVMSRPRSTAAGVRTRSTPAVAEWTQRRCGQRLSSRSKTSGRQRAAQQHFDVRQVAIGKPFERNGDERDCPARRRQSHRGRAGGNAPTGSAKARSQAARLSPSRTSADAAWPRLPSSAWWTLGLACPASGCATAACVARLVQPTLPGGPARARSAVPTAPATAGEPHRARRLRQHRSQTARHAGTARA